jgi:hypothetical protein
MTPKDVLNQTIKNLQKQNYISYSLYSPSQMDLIKDFN